MKYRKRPVLIDAYHYTGHHVAQFPQWLRSAVVQGMVLQQDDKLVIKTLEGVMYADVGDWVLRGVKGELYPCKPDIFEQTYEPVYE